MIQGFTKKRAFKVILILCASLILWFAITGIMIWKYGHKDFAKESDCIIVLGAAAYHDKPSPVFKERIRHAVSLYDEGKAGVIIFTGGYGDGAAFSESEVGARFAVSEGVDRGSILTEERSRTTQHNLVEAKKLMAANDLTTAIIVSDPLHLKRASAMAKDLDIEAVSSPTPTSRYQSLRTKLGFLVREIYFYNHYMVTGD